MLPIGHFIHLTYHQKYHGFGETTMRQNRDTMGRITILQYDGYLACTSNIYTNFGFSIYN